MTEHFQASFTCLTNELIRLCDYNYYISTELISSSALFNCIIRLIKCEWASHSALVLAELCHYTGGRQYFSDTCAHALEHNEYHLELYPQD